MRKLSISFIILHLFYSISIGQVTFSVEDFYHLYYEGHTLTYCPDTLKTEINIGTLGNNTWDFSNLLIHDQSTSESVRPFYTPFIAEFPQANYATETPFYFLNSSTNSYSYINLEATGFNLLGSKFQVSIQGDTHSEKVTYTPPQNSFIFPLTYLTEWNDTNEVNSLSLVNGNIVSSKSERHYINYKCDAYGKIKTPQNILVSALRLKLHKTIYDINTGTSFREVSYKFITPEGFSVSFVTVDSLSSDTGYVRIKNLVWTYLGYVGVQSETKTTKEYFLKQNYPNPFNPATKICFDLPTTSEVSLIIYDILGNKIKTLLHEELSEGAYSTTWIPEKNISAGVYFCKLISNNKINTIKMLYVK